ATAYSRGCCRGAREIGDRAAILAPTVTCALGSLLDASITALTPFSLSRLRPQFRMRTLVRLVPVLVPLLFAPAGPAAQGVQVEKSEVRFVSKQMGVAVEGRFRKWNADVDFRPQDL